MKLPEHFNGLQFKHASYRGVADGPRLVVLGAVHGNEVCGTKAIQGIMQLLDAGELIIEQGVVTFVPITNPLAYRLQQRNGDRNLNRNLTLTSNPLEFEDYIANWLCPLLAAHDVLLDLHSFQVGERPFAMLGPENNQGMLEPFTKQALERKVAMSTGVTRFVDGWLSTYERGVQRRVAELATVRAGASARANHLNTDSRYGVGTTEYMRSVGGCAVTLECGQHSSADAPQVAHNAIMNVMATLGLIGLPGSAAAALPTAIETLSLVEVIDKVDDSDAFSKSWVSFDRLREGDEIGRRANGEVIFAKQDGYIVFPNHKSQAGQEWFYLATLAS